MIPIFLRFSPWLQAMFSKFTRNRGSGPLNLPFEKERLKTCVISLRAEKETWAATSSRDPLLWKKLWREMSWK